MTLILEIAAGILLARIIWQYAPQITTWVLTVMVATVSYSMKVAAWLKKDTVQLLIGIAASPFLMVGTLMLGDFVYRLANGTPTEFTPLIAVTMATYIWLFSSKGASKSKYVPPPRLSFDVKKRLVEMEQGL